MNGQFRLRLHPSSLIPGLGPGQKLPDAHNAKANVVDLEVRTSHGAGRGTAEHATLEAVPAPKDPS